MDRKFAYFFITGDASVQLPSDSLSGTNFKLSSDNLYGTEGVVSIPVMYTSEDGSFAWELGTDGGGWPLA